MIGKVAFFFKGGRTHFLGQNVWQKINNKLRNT